MAKQIKSDMANHTQVVVGAGYCKNSLNYARIGNGTTNAQSGFLAAVPACRALGANAQWFIYLPK